MKTPFVYALEFMPRAIRTMLRRDPNEFARRIMMSPPSGPPPMAGPDSKVTFVVGSGRSGTHFLWRLLSGQPDLLAFHTDTAGSQVGDSFLHYCKWNQLDVDTSGFIESRRRLILHARARRQAYFESNAYLSLAASELHNQFSAKFIVLFRSPDRVVNSHWVKGWHERVPSLDHLDTALGFQYDRDRPHHSFTRVVPRGDDYLRWRNLTQIGRIAWMWNSVYLRIFAQLDRLPPNVWRTQQVERIDYGQYLALVAYAGGSSFHSLETFNRIRDSRPGKASRQRSAETWSPTERREFEEETLPARKRLGIL